MVYFIYIQGSRIHYSRHREIDRFYYVNQRKHRVTFDEQGQVSFYRIHLYSEYPSSHLEIFLDDEIYREGTNFRYEYILSEIRSGF